MQKSVSKHSQHVVNRASPILKHHLITISSYCDFNLSVPLCVKPCILLGHALFLRSSNLVSPSVESWGGPHTLKAGDIQSVSNKFIVKIISSKTRVSPVVIDVYSDPCVSICPVRAWNHYAATVSPIKSGPAFVVFQGRPLTAKVVVSCMREALT